MPERVHNRQAILAKLRALLPELHRQGVQQLWLFGSYARDEAGSASDLDLLVEFDRPPSLLRFIALEQRLSDRLGLKVDLVMRQALKPAVPDTLIGTRLDSFR